MWCPHLVSFFPRYDGRLGGGFISIVDGGARFDSAALCGLRVGNTALCVSHAMELKARGIRQSTLYSSTYRDDVGVKARVSFHLVLLTQAVN